MVPDGTWVRSPPRGAHGDQQPVSAEVHPAASPRASRISRPEHLQTRNRREMISDMPRHAATRTLPVIVAAMVILLVGMTAGTVAALVGALADFSR
jgi:hypothetical protein